MYPYLIMHTGRADIEEEKNTGLKKMDPQLSTGQVLLKFRNFLVGF